MGLEMLLAHSFIRPWCGSLPEMAVGWFEMAKL